MWCLCCNKWFCWLEVFFIWVVKWIVIIIGKWVVYIVCRVISLIETLAYTILNILGWPVKWMWCIFLGDSELDKLPLRTLELEVIIVDYDKATQNPCTNTEVDERIQFANRILRARARIAVKRYGPISRTKSKSLYYIDGSSLGAKILEYLKGFVLLLGRDSPTKLTVYVVGEIKGLQGLHLPLYGSVFIEPGTNDITLCHELGHALLGLANTYHSSKKDYLMYPDPAQVESSSGWPKDLPKLTRNERCTMRRSRWISYSWIPVIP